MKELKQQLLSALLVVLTVAAVVAAAINLQQQSRFHLPDDGITWLDQQHGENKNSTVVAAYVAAGSPGEKAGIHKGDLLVSVADLPIQNSLDVTAVLARLGAWKKVEYKILHGGVEVTSNVIVGEATRDSTLFYQYAVGAVYLLIGLFVYFRRGSAPRALHFFALCLASFILSTFHYSGKLNNFDKVIYLGNLVAGFLAPTLFLHFCLIFPERPRWIRKTGAVLLVYLPGLALLSIHLGFVFGYVSTLAPLLEMRWLLDRVWLAFLSAMYLIGALVLNFQLKHAEDPVVRRQLTWLRNGALVGILPFTAVYVIPYMLGWPPSNIMNLAVLSLPLIPLTWAYAILRYRLMDVDIIFQEGYVYTLATLAVLGIFYGLLFSVTKTADLSGAAMVALILIATVVFQPIRNWIQEQLDRYYFYKDRYDYRRTLIEFARELGSPTDMGEMLESVADRLIRTLGIRHVAFFVWNEAHQEFDLELASNRAGRQTDHVPPGLDLSFLKRNPGKPYLFFERTRNMLDVISHEWPVSVRRAIADLDLTYYLPCSARGRTIAYLGVSRTESGDFLSSDDVELLVTLSSYVGIAVDNSTLYESLERKVAEYERLKEFSENIVESIHVGILAADLEGRVESWNTQMENLTSILRVDAVGRKLTELLPAELCQALDPPPGAELNDAAPEGESHEGIRNIYKFLLKRPSNSPGVSATGSPGDSPNESNDQTLNIAIAPLISREGVRIGRLVIFDDVTDRAELEKRLVQADKLSSIGLLAAGVAHEVNTPLAVISTYAQMLAKQISGDAQKAPLLEKIAKQTFRASEIVNSLLNFSRTSPTEFEGVDMNRVVKETLTLIEHQLMKGRVEVRTHYDETLPRIKGSSGKLQQVFLNLFLNARDAMENGGILTVSTSHVAGQVHVVVEDNGMGIAPEHVNRIFDPFFTTKGAKKGTGLGLSVSYGIVQEHAGEIEVESQLGRGTRFELSFPEVSLLAMSAAKVIGNGRAAMPQHHLMPAAAGMIPSVAALNASAAGTVSALTPESAPNAPESTAADSPDAPPLSSVPMPAGAAGD
jgi:nitrogen-specific signal transduction histidine kinase